jgi:hypothetical protein
MRATTVVRSSILALTLIVSTSSVVAAAPASIGAAGPGSLRVDPMVPTPPHSVYVVDSVTTTANTNGPNVRTGVACIGCYLAHTFTYGWSNTWSATITGFPKGPVSAAVGFDVTLSGSDSYTVSWQVPAGKTGEIWYYDQYHNKRLGIHTMLCGAPCFNYVYGTAYTKQWYRRVFYLVTK